MTMSRIEMGHGGVLSPASRRLLAALQRAGWELTYADADLSGERPTAELRLDGHDGRWVTARVDALGRCSIERFQRTKGLRMASDTLGRRPLTPLVEDVFLGRTRSPGPAAMIASLADYLASNGREGVDPRALDAEWTASLAGPLRLVAAPPPEAQAGTSPVLAEPGA